MGILGKIANLASGNSGSLIGAGASILGTMMNNKTQLKQQQREMDFARESYNIQREDVLDDRAHEEAYNSPIQQAQRLRQAGMNPMDYMGDPVSTSTGDSGQIAQPGSANLTNPMASLSEFINNERQFDFAKSQFQETKRVNDSIIDKNRAEADSVLADESRKDTRIKIEQQQHDMAMNNFNEELRSMRLDNKAKSILISHNEVMYPLIERGQKVQTEIDEKTKDTVISKCKAELNLDYAKARELAQLYEIRGPEAFSAQLTKDMYGDNADMLRNTIMDQMHCDADEANVAMVNIGIEAGVLHGEYGDGVQSLAVVNRIRSDVKGDQKDNGSSRGLLGAIVKTLAK